MEDCILVTGGAGFIGTNFVIDWLANEDGRIVNLDKLTYAGNPANLISASRDARYTLAQADIGDVRLVTSLLAKYRPRAIVHFAAESHVDRSITGPADFIDTNVVGTFRLLEATRTYLATLNDADKQRFRFLHVSTDEVYGSLHSDDAAFLETTPYAPTSPYAASKAASDHLVRAYLHTYGLPTLITNCSNNYGPYQFPEKLIPLMILNAIEGRELPIYGDGRNVRDWLYVSDHCSAIRLVLERGRIGESYNIGGESERTNLEVVRELCAILDDLLPASPHRPHFDSVRFVPDRPGHDRRYAVNAGKISKELGWRPVTDFSFGLRATVAWYLANQGWSDDVRSGAYRDWVDLNYRRRA